MSERQQILDVLHRSVAEARDRGLSGELVLSFPHWAWDRYGPFTAQEFGVSRIDLVATVGGEDANRVQVLLYQRGDWHTRHAIGETHPDCEGCQASP